MNKGVSLTKLIAGILILVISSLTHAKMTDLDYWLVKQEQAAIEKMMANISPEGTAKGVVIASPEKVTPNYFSHWVRDSALTMDLVVELYKNASGTKKALYRQKLLEFADFSRTNQTAPTISGMGEPKFNVDGTAFSGPWCRPQNDGPALRAITLIHLANVLLDEGESQYVKSKLYDGKIPTDSVIKADLEFVSHHWREANCDLWEETFGHHFYTEMVQRRAMVDGAKLARRLNDKAAAKWYEAQAKELESAILAHWSPEKSIFISTLNPSHNTKQSGLDSSVILALLHGHTNDGFLPYTDKRVIETYKSLVSTFKAIYPINQKSNVPGTAIGRYPEDIYDGDQYKYGNPWVLITAAFARYSKLVAKEYSRKGKKKDAALWAAESEAYFERLRFHANPDGSMSEQMDRYSGYMISARDLTWSYSEFLHAKRER